MHTESFRERAAPTAAALAEEEVGYVDLAFDGTGSVAEDKFKFVPCDKVFYKQSAMRRLVRVHWLFDDYVKDRLVVKDGMFTN